MKHSLFIISIVICLLGTDSICAQIQGTYPQNNVALSLLRITGQGHPDTLETVITRNGKFTFKTQPQEAGIYTLFLHDLTWSIPMLLENQSNTILIPDLQSVQIKSGKLQKQITDCQQKLQKLTKQQIAITELLKQEKDKSQQEKLRNKQAQLEKESHEITKHYIRNNSTNMAGLFLAWNRMEWVNFQELENRYLLLDEKLQTSPIGQSIRQKIDERWRLKPGIVARDFTMPDTSGHPVTLSKIQAKVKILDFWASWCIPCRATNKKLVELYEKYKDKGLEIISISIDSSEEQWKKAIRHDGCNWIHLSELNTGKDALYRQYKVFSVPSCFLLDENNQCIAISTNGEDFEKIIGQILKHSSETL
ncbi:MAG: AhpC/TSA family protein [Odoribacter sp.]|nr:AhpC/TSA family protein [Odoribacter sp.]